MPRPPLGSHLHTCSLPGSPFLTSSTRPALHPAGSEGFGLRTNVRRACSGLVRVEMSSSTAAGRRGPSGGAGAVPGQQEGQEQQHEEEDGGAESEGAGGPGGRGAGLGLHGLVDSLNVSVAAGILMHSLLRSAAAGSAAAGAGGRGAGGKDGASSPEGTVAGSA